MKKPQWLEFAEQHIGQSEVPGAGSSVWIKNLWFALKGGWLWKQYGEDDSRLAWCGAFVAFCLKAVDLPVPVAWYRASAYLEWGVKLEQPRLGCICVISRVGGHHVFFPVAISKDGKRIVGFGGNQSDKVRYSVFDATTVKGYRWPACVPLGDLLPIVNTSSFLQDIKMD